MMFVNPNGFAVRVSERTLSMAQSSVLKQILGGTAKMNEAERNDLRDIPHQTAHQMVAGVGQRLVEVRGPALQKAFAKLLGVHVNTYARWERGESECGASALARLYQLGINPTWVVTGRGPKKPEAPPAR